VTTHSGPRRGVDGRTPEREPEAPEATRGAFHGLMSPLAEYIAKQPSPNLMRAAASRIAQAVIATGDDLASGGSNRWEGP
jgi:hypothetical protein